jgi:hypothetical protein
MVLRLAAALAATAAVASATPKSGPLQVFLLAGQWVPKTQPKADPNAVSAYA